MSFFSFEVSCFWSFPRSSLGRFFLFERFFSPQIKVHLFFCQYAFGVFSFPYLKQGLSAYSLYVIPHGRPSFAVDSLPARQDVERFI